MAKFHQRCGETSYDMVAILTLKWQIWQCDKNGESGTTNNCHGFGDIFLWRVSILTKIANLAKKIPKMQKLASVFQNNQTTLALLNL